MKKSFLILSGLFFAATVFAAIPECRASIASGRGLPGLSMDIDCYRIVSECGSGVMPAAEIESEKEIVRVPGGEGRDEDNFDPEMEPLICAGEEGILTIVQPYSAACFEAYDTAAFRPGNKARAP